MDGETVLRYNVSKRILSRRIVKRQRHTQLSGALRVSKLRPENPLVRKTIRGETRTVYVNVRASIPRRPAKIFTGNTHCVRSSDRRSSKKKKTKNINGNVYKSGGVSQSS